MIFYTLAFLIAVAQATQFSVKDGNITCLMLSLEGSLTLAAEPKKNSSEEAISPVNLPFKDASVLGTSTCDVIKLDMNKSAEVWFQFTNSSGSYEVTPISAFNAKDVFGLDNENFTFKADPLEAFDPKTSFLCKAKEDYNFKEQGTPSANYTFTVVATVQNFQIQSLKGSEFANATECKADMTTTPTPQTSTTKTSTSPAPHSTTTPPEPVVNATCKDGNVTRVRLSGSFQLAITYNGTDPKTNKTVVMTRNINVPAGVDTSNSKCEANSSVESLKLNFFGNWSILFNIVSDSSSAQLTAGTAEYHVANITVHYVYDNNLPFAKEPGTPMDVTYTDGGKNYLKATGSGYYTCKANTTISMGANSMVKLSSENLKYKAFNDKGDAEFKGDVSECSADDDTSSVVPIAVGAALAGLVVIVLIAYLIGRKRSRKSGYESV